VVDTLPTGTHTVTLALGDLSGKVLVDCTNPVRWDGGPVWSPPAAGSLTAAVKAAQPSAQVVKAFNGFGAEFHAEGLTVTGGPGGSPLFQTGGAAGLCRVGLKS